MNVSLLRFDPQTPFVLKTSTRGFTSSSLGVSTFCELAGIEQNPVAELHFSRFLTKVKNNGCCTTTPGSGSIYMTFKGYNSAEFFLSALKTAIADMVKDVEVQTEMFRRLCERSGIEPVKIES